MEQTTEASQAVDLPVLPHLPRAVGYLHTMDNTEGLKGNQPWRIFNFIKRNPFGKAGLDYSASYPVTNEALFTASQMKEYARAALKAQPAHDRKELTTTGVDSQITLDLNIKAQPAPTEAQGDPVADFIKWIESRGPLGPGALSERIFIAGWYAGNRAEQGAQLSGNSGELAQGEDSARLEFMMQREAWIAWSKDGESCRVFHRNEEGDTGPIMGWVPEAWLHDPREAIDRARASAETGGVKP